MSYSCSKIVLLLILATAVFVVTISSASSAPNFVWIESESPTSLLPNVIRATVDDDGEPTLLSNGKWLKIDIAASAADASVPSDGITISYSLSVASTAQYQIWNRLGFEAVRSDFHWRVDDGPWSTVTSSAPTTDVDELQTWNPIGWLDMGSQTLAVGAHTLQIRLNKSVDAAGKTKAILYASDALCLCQGDFHPNDQYRPNDLSWISDRDKSAAANAFAVSMPSDVTQEATSLNGDWQIARDDEMVVSDPSGPITTLPSADSLYWRSMVVPGNRDSAIPDWLYCHRYWLRTRITVPSNLAGHSYYLHFPAISMTATLFVNGTHCGFTKTPFAAWDCDVTSAIKPGQTNEIWVGIKDWYYALPDNGAKDGGHIQYIPTDWVTKYGPANFTFPVWNHSDNGLIRTPSFVVAGGVYTSDVFAKPSVKTSSLGLDITLQNPTNQSQTVSVENSVTPLSGGNTAKTFAPTTVTVRAGQSSTVSLVEFFSNATLWWPDSPFQYNVVTTVSIDGKELDRRTTKFGFREWTWSGASIELNGVPWHGRADLVDYGRADDEATAVWKSHGQDMERMWGEGTFSGLTPDDALDYYDSHGVVIRRTGIFDGEAARYQLTDGNHVRQELFDNWQAQLLAWAKGERNHPSIFIWSIENEIAYINANVFGLTPVVDPAERKVAAALQELDPTRPVMTDGGNALLDESMPVYGGHYMEPEFESLPEGAYDFAGFAHREVWPITQSKPIILGEAFYANGDQPADFATVGGESAFLGKAESHPAIGLTAKMLSEGYRWNGISFHFWIGGESDSYYNSWQPVAVLCREWDWTFGSGQTVSRTCRIFNDTHDSSPITLKWTLQLNGSTISTSSHSYVVAPGGTESMTIELPMPTVGVRSQGIWTRSLLRSGHTVFTDAKPFSLLPRMPVNEHVAATKVAVYDPGGVLQQFLRSRGLNFTSVDTLASLPQAAKVLLIGRNALTLEESTSSALSAYASSGRCVIVLEQQNPLKFQGLPIDAESTNESGDIGFVTDLTHPVLAGLMQSDFFTWGPDGALYDNAYRTSSSGGRSLVECGSRLENSGLMLVTPGSGAMLLCQLVAEQKLSSNAVAQQLVLNMIRYGLKYKLVNRQTVVSSQDAQLTGALDAIHLQCSQGQDVLTAINQPGEIAVVSATPANLLTLANNQTKLNAFTSAGGWLILNDLTPEGLSSYDQIVGFQHIIRPFHQEKVEFSTVRNPLTVGLSPADIVMGNGHNIFDWEAGQYSDQDAFSYVVDLDDIAPFCTSTFGGWRSITNGYTMADGFWPLIINFPAPTDGKPFGIPITLPQPETITKVTFVGDNNYWQQTGLNLNFGGTDNVPLTYDPGDKSSAALPETYDINPPRTVSNMTLQITGWNALPAVAGNIGIDNLYINVKRPPDFDQRVKPMLNIGALVEYPRGTGGIVLCNIRFKDPLTESNPENAGKKQAIIATILKNLNAEFSGGKTIIAGAADLTYSPIDLKAKANQYLNEQGWFGDKHHTFADFPTGRQVLGGVPYEIYDFTTSPVPTVVMLGGNGIPGNLPDSVTGIAVNQQADALFFLQAARIDQPMSPDDIKNNRKFEMADYEVHYSDGTIEKVPIFSQFGVDNYKEESPTALPGAQIAWLNPYPADPNTAVAYSMEWTNPHPDKVIDTIDLTYGPDRWRGVPCLIAVTAALAD
jgi:hypothetical protein